MNIFTISGRCGRDPEVKFGNSGSAVCKFVVAVDWYKGKEKPKETDWIEVVCFKGQAEFVGNNLTKGKLITVSGAGHVEKWEKDGVKHSKFVLYANDVSFEVGKKAETEPEPQADAQATFGGTEEDIPF